MHLLLVEDQPKVAGFIRRGLEEERYSVDVVSTGTEALQSAFARTYDLVVLDIMLPDISGFSVCRQLREEGLKVPVLMLTARDELDDKVTGLDAGADDYLTKPFAFPEFLARVRALLRRLDDVKSSTLQIADLVLDTSTHDVRRGATHIELASKEYAVLEYLMRRAGKVVTRTMMLDAVWGYEFDPGSNIVDVYIRYLRRKIDDPFPVKLLHTIRGTGYSLRAPRVP